MSAARDYLILTCQLNVLPTSQSPAASYLEGSETKRVLAAMRPPAIRADLCGFAVCSNAVKNRLNVWFSAEHQTSATTMTIKPLFRAGRGILEKVDEDLRALLECRRSVPGLSWKHRTGLFNCIM